MGLCIDGKCFNGATTKVLPLQFISVLFEFTLWDSNSQLNTNLNLLRRCVYHKFWFSGVLNTPENQNCCLFNNNLSEKALLYVKFRRFTSYFGHGLSIPLTASVLAE